MVDSENYQGGSSNHNYMGGSDFMSNKEEYENEIFWENRDGQKINIKDMSVSHLENTLKMILNNGFKNMSNESRKYWLKTLTDELVSR